VFAPEQIASRLGDRFQLLTGGSRTALPRQHTLRALIDWSYDLLSEPECALLRGLSVFAGGWTFEAAEAIAPDLDVLNLLTQLVNKSLVVAEDQSGETRYRFLETIRQYARDRLFEADEAEVTRNRHLDYFLRLTEQARDAIENPKSTIFVTLGATDIIAQLEQLWLEFDNVRAALEWGLEHRPEDALTLAMLLWIDQVEPTEARRWLQEGLARVDALPPVEGEAAIHRAKLRIRGVIAVSSQAIRQGESAKVRPLLEDAVVKARAVGDPFILAGALGILSLALRFVGDIPAMRAPAEESVALLRQSNQKSWLGMSLITLAWAEGHAGDLEARRKHIAEALALVADTSDVMTYNFYFSASQEARALGELDAARSYLQKCFALLPLLRDRNSSAMITSELAHVGRQSGALDTATALYEETILQWKDLGHRAAVANQLECLGFIARAQGQANRAARLLSAAEALRELAGAPMMAFERVEYDREVATLHEQLDDMIFASEWAAGRAMSMDQAIGYALTKATLHQTPT
jgi:non-specific serine/threonine protein kinase